MEARWQSNVERRQAAGLSPLKHNDEEETQVSRQSSWAVGRYESTQAKPPLHVFPEAFNAPRTPPPTAAEIQKQVVVDHSEHAVNVALMINGVVFFGKLLVYFWTSSDVMLAEAVHSLADIANQALLAYGIYLSRRAPDKWHPYGYGKDRFIWALISATGIFCCGAGINIVHGVHCLMAPEPVANIGLGLAVLAASGLAEGGSFWVAYKAVRDSAKAENMPTIKYLWAGLDPTAVAVLMEDGAAVIGLGVAAAALVATHATGNPVYDAIGSIGVGVLLGGVAAFLIQRNRSALLGRSMDEHEMQELMHLLKADPVVHAIYDAKSEVIGPGEFRFKAEIDFRGHVVVRHFLQRAGHRQVLDHFEKALANNTDAAVEEALEQYGTAIVQSIGDEVDRLEQVIQRKVPEMRHVDIEVHSRFGKSAYR
ncbi:hypothetical protein KFL_001870105 [Klebsormidium nitens]|uniref:Cation efflux protein transmembrane domain-containing protein n=1 Tax=Klebsormidium nitens TaxID=105231 RepID=A0A1Y1I4P1_KLENI|nr:hypothetical protein KFL_001870105 [Klebsormidium nitens]|eukprot:GAQ84389.1 hypothetical protein KFL_001870105 [Klebsormidium nitens]